MLGAAMQAPLTGLVLTLELTHGGFPLLVPLIAATVTATVVARYVDGYSIYSARLHARPGPPARPEPAAAPPPRNTGVPPVPLDPADPR